jgi:prevent-host-death family protein
VTKTVNLKELRPRLPRVMEAVDKRLDRFVVTKRGHPMAVILSVDDYEGLLETIAVLQDKRLMKRLRKAQAEARAGRTRSLDEVHRRLATL